MTHFYFCFLGQLEVRIVWGDEIPWIVYPAAALGMRIVTWICEILGYLWTRAPEKHNRDRVQDSVQHNFDARTILDMSLRAVAAVVTIAAVVALDIMILHTPLRRTLREFNTITVADRILFFCCVFVFVFLLLLLGLQSSLFLDFFSFPFFRLSHQQARNC